LYIIIATALALILLYELGTLNINAKNWTASNAHKDQESADDMYSSELENETSNNEAANTSSEPVTKKRGSKKENN
jgi:hypothetical protein